MRAFLRCSVTAARARGAHGDKQSRPDESSMLEPTLPMLITIRHLFITTFTKSIVAVLIAESGPNGNGLASAIHRQVHSSYLYGYLLPSLTRFCNNYSNRWVDYGMYPLGRQRNKEVE